MGTAMAIGDGVGHGLSAAAALFAAVMIQIGTNLANDCFDCLHGADQCDRVGPVRVTQSGLATPNQVLVATALAFALACAAGLYLVIRGGWPILLIGLLSILSGILYTAGPYPLGYHGLGELFVLVFFGPVAVAGTYYVQALQVTPTVLLIGLAPGLMSVAILTVNNIRDRESDRRAGKRTLAVRFGLRIARLQYVLSVVGAGILPIAMVLATGRHVCCLLTVLVSCLMIPTIRKVYRLEGGPELNAVLAATGRSLFVFGLVFATGYLL
jgi:1,4-dihydroxy-2-naphthoate octaprenyltransferase